MKHEWRKKEKAVYLPKSTPEVVNIPPYKFISICGEGNPNSDTFGDYIGTLYSVAYAIKMSLKKKDKKPSHYIDWTVYPLEGVWDITEEAKKIFNGTINKDDLVFELMIRQPDFIDISYFTEMLAFTKKKKENILLDKVEFKTIDEGKCIQMMHIGSYDSEPDSFDKMEEYATSLNLVRKSKMHREIYISDFRKVQEDKLRTVLRFLVDG